MSLLILSWRLWLLWLHHWFWSLTFCFAAVPTILMTFDHFNDLDRRCRALPQLPLLSWWPWWSSITLMILIIVTPYISSGAGLCLGHHQLNRLAKRLHRLLLYLAHNWWYLPAHIILLFLHKKTYFASQSPGTTSTTSTTNIRHNSGLHDVPTKKFICATNMSHNFGLLYDILATDDSFARQISAINLPFCKMSQ